MQGMGCDGIRLKMGKQWLGGVNRGDAGLFFFFFFCVGGDGEGRWDGREECGVFFF